jgi:hypothetical protein
MSATKSFVCTCFCNGTIARASSFELAAKPEGLGILIYPTPFDLILAPFPLLKKQESCSVHSAGMEVKKLAFGRYLAFFMLQAAYLKLAASLYHGRLRAGGCGHPGPLLCP